MRDSDRDYLIKYLEKDELSHGLKLLEEGVSPQYIVGNVDFYGNVIKIDKRVLIPRFETELLVERVIFYINKYFDKKDLSILDIGTGSGCIAIALKKRINSYVIGVDVSKEAIELAIENGKLNNTYIDFRVSDLFSAVDKKFDVIVSNPPYIDRSEVIEDIVLNNEPHLALFAEDKGLYFYDKILRDAKNYLNDKFLIAFEIGYLQGEAVKNLAYKYLDNVSVMVEKDYSDKDRFVFIISK